MIQVMSMNTKFIVPQSKNQNKYLRPPTQMYCVVVVLGLKEVLQSNCDDSEESRDFTMKICWSVDMYIKPNKLYIQCSLSNG